MERDFMGLAAKVKDLINSDSEEPVDAVRSVAMQWSFSNKNPPNTPLHHHHHQIIMQNPPNKTGFDSLASAGLVSITTFEARYANNNLVQGGRKKSVVPEKEAVGGVSYSVHQPPTTTHRENMTVLPSSMSTNKMMINPFAQNRIGSTNATVNNQISNHHLPVVGTTDLRNSPKILCAPAQLTIFYNGSVCVYDNLSPEKAQAIMLLAGNGPQAATSSSSAKNPVEASVIEGFVLSQHHDQFNTTSISISKVSAGNNNDTTAVKLGGELATTSDSVPQFRVKSLARFLEKRKQRVISSAPYTTKQSAAETPNSSGSSSG